MKSRDEQREEQRRYDEDVFYDVWRSGGNPDRIDAERVMDHYYDGHSHEEAARAELRRQRSGQGEQFDECEMEEQDNTEQ